jgi:transcriptional regulator with XRE-family HTH domain
MLGEKIKNLREKKGLLQRQLAARLDVDTAFISKVENGEKRLSKTHLNLLSKMLGVTEKELINLWLADKVISVIDEEEEAEQAIKIVQEYIKQVKNKC